MILVAVSRRVQAITNTSPGATTRAIRGMPSPPILQLHRIAGTRPYLVNCHRNSIGFRGTQALRLRANTVQALLCAASFLCCVPMAMPSSHLVAFCSDLGIAPAQGAAMLSVMLGSAFVSRMFWGWLADRVGGLGTVFAGSACQALAIAAFAVTKNEAALFAIAAAYGLGFSGIIPAYVVAIRQFFPSSEASWRVPTLLFAGMSGMAFGSWFAGALYDYFHFYAPAFAAGALFNLGNLAVVGFLLVRQTQAARLTAALEPVPDIKLAQ